MSLDQSKDQARPLETLKTGSERLPDIVDPVTAAHTHIEEAQKLSDKAASATKQVDHLYRALTLDQKNPPTVDTTLGFNLLKADTQKVLERRIAEAERLLKEHEADWHNSPASRGNMLSMKPTYKQPAELAGPLARLKDAYEKVKTTTDEHYLQQLRVDMGLPALPRQLVAATEDFDDMAREAATNADPTMQTNLEFLRKEFEEVETILTGAEYTLQVLDTGMSIAAGFVPYGSEVYELSRSLTHVAQGTMSPEQAAREFVIGVAASKMGGKIADKLKLDEIATVWVKRNAKHFSKEAAENLARVLGKTTGGAAQGGITGTLEGGMHGTYNVATGQSTVEQAIDDTVNRALIGMLFGGVTAGGMEGWKIRGERLNTAQQQRVKDMIMSLPETDTGRSQRVTAAESLLGKELTPQQRQAVLDAHDVPMADGEKYSLGELGAKMRILEESGFSRNEADQLLRMGVCGVLPPPPIPKPKITLASQPTVGPKPPPPPPVPGIRKIPLAPPAAPSAKNAVTQKTSPLDADIHQPSPKNRVPVGPTLKRAPRETPQNTKFLKEYGHLTEEQLALDPQLENTLEEMKKRGLFSTQFYYEGQGQEHMDISRSSDKLDLHTLHLSDLRNNINVGPSNARGNDYQRQAHTLEKAGIHELLISKPIRAKVRAGTRKEMEVREEPGLLWGKKIIKKEVDKPFYEERDIRFSEVVSSSNNNEPCVSLTYFVLGAQSYQTNQLNNATKNTQFYSKHGYDINATQNPSFKPNVSHDAMQDGILQHRDAASKLHGRPGNQISISLTLPKSEAEKLQKYFQAHPEEIRPFFLRGGQEYMLTHMPPPFAKWDEQPRPVRFRTFDAEAKTFKDEDVKRPGM